MDQSSIVSGLASTPLKLRCMALNRQHLCVSQLFKGHKMLCRFNVNF